MEKCPNSKPGAFEAGGVSKSTWVGSPPGSLAPGTTGASFSGHLMLPAASSRLPLCTCPASAPACLTRLPHSEAALTSWVSPRPALAPHVSARAVFLKQTPLCSSLTPFSGSTFLQYEVPDPRPSGLRPLVICPSFWLPPLGSSGVGLGLLSSGKPSGHPGWVTFSSDTAPARVLPLL